MDPFTIQSLAEEPERTANSKPLVLYSGSIQELPKHNNPPPSTTHFRPPHTQTDPHKPAVISEANEVTPTGNLRTVDDIGYSFGTCLPYVGNYCGPYYSAGSIQPSVVSDVAPCSDADEVCMQHDSCYAHGNNHADCDYAFVENPDADPLMASLVRMQITARDLYSNWSNLLNTTQTMTNKRGKNKQASNNNKPKQTKQKKAQKFQTDMQLVHAPTAISVRNSNVPNKPVYRTSKTGVVISHSEMIMGVPVGAGAPTAYAVGKLVINPGKFTTFPWLATIATNYDKYIFKKLRFIYMPLVATSTAGRVGIAYDYDSSDATPNNRADFFSMTRHSEAAIWAPITLEVPLDNVERFTNTHTLTDSKLIDVGSIIYMTDASSATAASVVGDLLCEYEVELRRPQSPSYVTQQLIMTPGFSTIGQDLSNYTYGPNVAGFSASTTSAIGIGGLSPGRYKVECYVYDSAAGTPTLSITLLGSVVAAGTDRVVTSTSSSIGIFCFDVKTGNGGVLVNCAINYSACERLGLYLTKMESAVQGLP